jgi:PIN domain nuclease of toxin-antitoxin system
MPELILDTCALIWLVNGGGRLSAGTLKAIADANIVFVSAASAMEIGCKFALGKLKLAMAPEEWYHQALEHHGIVELPIDGSTCFGAARLPMLHRDPADRLVIAAAKARGIPVATHDTRFESYGVMVLR